MRSLLVLVACEESQTVCAEFRKLGHIAFSCDVVPCTGGHPEWHIQSDVLPILNPAMHNSKFIAESEYGLQFQTMDGWWHEFPGKWDLIIAHPPCTHLALSGAKHFEKKRADGRQAEAIEFFARFLDIDCDHVAIENPVGIINGGKYLKTYFPELAEKYSLPRPAQQKIQPWMFGDPFEKTTLLWLKNLPELVPTNEVTPEPRHVTVSGKSLPGWYSNPALRTGVHGNRQTVRSRTFDGTARAMAERWSGFILDEEENLNG